MAKHLLLSTLAAAFALVASPAAVNTEPQYSGTGWLATLDQPIQSIHPDGYEIVFASHAARIVVRPYLTGPAAQITAITGVPVTVTTKLDTTPVGTCPARHRIIVTYEHQPMGLPGYSQARPCWDTRDNSAWGGHVRMDSEYWTVYGWFGPDFAVNEMYRKNVTAHELGHIFGLDHPNEDLDGDGAAEGFECVKNAAGWTPLMCSPNGGYRTSEGAGRYVAEFDVPGLQQLAQNWHLAQTN